MLAPEVWTFDPPANLLKVKEGYLGADIVTIENLIKSHHFNHVVSVVLPDTLEVPETIQEALTIDCQYYKITNFPVSELMAKEFIDAFIKKGQLTLLSINNCVDVDNCIAVIGSGQLVLSLNRESFQELGVEGKPTLSKSKPHQRYLVTVDLTSQQFLPGKKYHDRVIKCIHKYLETFDVILTWDSGDEKVCPSSVASYLHRRGLQVQLCKPQLGHRTEYNVNVPIMHPREAACSADELLEWLGAFSLDVTRHDCSEEQVLSSYVIPEENTVCGQVALLKWSGFFSTQKIISLFQELRDFVHERGDIPWVSLYVQGFSDSPVSWSLKEHVYYTDGDNSFTVLMKPDKTYDVASLNSNHKMIR